MNTESKKATTIACSKALGEDIGQNYVKLFRHGPRHSRSMMMELENTFMMTSINGDIVKRLVLMSIESKKATTFPVQKLLEKILAKPM